MSLKNRIEKKFNKLYYEPIYVNKLFHNLKILGADIPIFPDGSSGNAGLLYTLLKILYTAQPSRVLELGIGQSSFICNLICKKFPDIYCLSVENDIKWYNPFASKLERENHHFKNIELLKTIINYNSEVFESNFYDLSGLTEKFNLVLLDGPFGGKNRFGVLKYIKTIVHPEDFILVIDDVNRKAEARLANLIEQILHKELNGDIVSFTIYAQKYQRIILSAKNGYLRTI